MRVLVANVVYTNKPPVVAATLHKLISRHDPDVLGLVETKNVDLRRALPSWHVHQGPSWDLGRRNAAIAWRAPVQAGRRRFILGTDAPGILARHITRARLSYGDNPKVGVDVMHLAPGRVDSANRTYERNIEGHAHNLFKLWCGDMNESRVPELALRYGLEMRRVGVMFAATNLPIRRFRVDHVNAFDHAVLILDVDAPGVIQ